MSDNSKYVTPTPSDPVKNMPGTYKDDVDSIPEADRFQETTMPMAPAPSPFKVGPLSGGR
jgi:hypothetical protein